MIDLLLVDAESCINVLYVINSNEYDRAFGETHHQELLFAVFTKFTAHFTFQIYLVLAKLLTRAAHVHLVRFV